MENTIKETNFQFPGQTGFYRGKVRDVYMFSDQLVMVATDRISAFDVILPKPIPCKGQVLNQIAAYFLNATADLVPNWLINVPDPNVSLGYACQPFKVEMVVRGYLAGHAWRTYREGKRLLSGVLLPENLKENDPLPAPIITPTTKADEGHDEDISKDQIISRQIVSEDHYEQLENYALRLFERGSGMARRQGLILVDTKYEFGIRNGEILLIDEIHTPDSSRYYYLEGYEEYQKKGQAQKQLSKEFVREWLISSGFQGKDGQKIPEMDDERLRLISHRYIELFEKLTGRAFEPAEEAEITKRIERNIRTALEQFPVKV